MAEQADEIDAPDPLSPDFWRERKHLFVPASWGPTYCRACADPDGGSIHDVVTDPSTHVGNCTDYRVARQVEVIYAVNGWSDDGAACSFGAHQTIEEALRFAHSDRAVRSDGRRYDHYQIDQRTYFTACDTNVWVLDPDLSLPPAGLTPAEALAEHARRFPTFGEDLAAALAEQSTPPAKGADDA